jgi:hypothetical protein
VALTWAVVGVALTLWVTTNRRDRLRDMERVYVEDDEPTAGAGGDERVETGLAADR